MSLSTFILFVWTLSVAGLVPAWFQNPRGNRTDFAYDVLNRQIAVTNPPVDSVRTVKFTGYDELGNRILNTDEAGVKTAFNFDGLGRLLSVTNDFKTNGTSSPFV